MLQEDPAARPGIIEILQDPWLQEEAMTIQEAGVILRERFNNVMQEIAKDREAKDLEI